MRTAALLTLRLLTVHSKQQGQLFRYVSSRGALKPWWAPQPPQEPPFPYPYIKLLLFHHTACFPIVSAVHLDPLCNCNQCVRSSCATAHALLHVEAAQSIMAGRLSRQSSAHHVPRKCTEGAHACVQPFSPFFILPGSSLWQDTSCTQSGLLFPFVTQNTSAGHTREESYTLRGASVPVRKEEHPCSVLR